MTRYMVIFGTALAALSIGTASAQDRLAAQTYGQGVHAFYRGNTTQANQYFNDAILAGFNDPRVYYFRAISKMKSGDTYGAESDIRLGADLEVNGSGAYDVGRALERIQGHLRVRFENKRREAKLEAMQTRANRPQPQLPPVAPEPTRDYLESVPAPPNEMVPPAPEDAENPFLDDEDDGVVLDEPGVEGPNDPTDALGDDSDVVEEEAPVDDLFGDETEGLPMDDTAPTEGTEDDGLFGDPAAGDEPPPAEIEAADDLFGDDPSVDELFGDEEFNKSSTSSEDLEALFD